VTKVKTPARRPRAGIPSQPTIATGAGLPGNIKSDLVDVRTAAIHWNMTLAREVAKLALELAKGVVMCLDPLPR
jgi:hypothetical protein